MKYIKGFDTLRAIAVLSVILGHWGPSFTAGTPADLILTSFVQYGTFGVLLFFVLSGFLITSILLNEKEKHADEKKLTIIKNFFFRRMLRIFPIYYLVIFIYYFIIRDPYVRDTVWYFITYTSNLPPYWTNKPNVLSHTWSLSVEEQFYLIWPWLMIMVRKEYLKYIFAASIIMGIVVKYIVLYPLHHIYPALVFNCFDSFGIGGLYAYMRQDKEKCKKFERNFVLVLALLLFLAWKMRSIAGIPFFVMYSRTLDSLIALGAIMFVLKNQSEWVRKYILENRPLNFIGRISYGIYLYHFSFGPAFDKAADRLLTANPSLPHFLANYYFQYCVKFSLLIFICWLSFKFIEQPIMRLKKKFEYASK